MTSGDGCNNQIVNDAETASDKRSRRRDLSDDCSAARNDNAINVPDIDIETDTELFLIIFS